MDFDAWAAFLLAALITAFMPGQGVLLAVSNSLERGRRGALMSSCGNVAGILVICGAAAAGLGMLVRSTPGALQVIKFAGAIYLMYLGLQLWRPASRHQGVPKRSPAAFGGPKLFLQGLTVATTNPKSILFICAMVPQFAGAGAQLSLRFFVMTTTFATCSAISHLFFILSAPWVSKKLGQAGYTLIARRIGGVGFIFLGLSVLMVRI